MKIGKVKRVQLNSKKEFAKEIKEASARCIIAQTYLNRAIPMKKKELVLLAIDLYQDALNIYPKCIEAYTGLAYIEYVWGDMADSYRLLNQAKEFDPINITVIELLKKVEKELIKKEIEKVRKSEKKEIEKKLEQNNQEKIGLNKMKSLIKNRLANVKTDNDKNFLSSLQQVKKNQVTENTTNLIEKE